MPMLAYSFFTSISVSLGGSTLAWTSGFAVLYFRRHTLSALVSGLLAARSTLALLYSISYVWLLLHKGSLKSWTQFVFGVAIVAWIVSWVLPNLVILFSQPKEKAGDTGTFTISPRPEPNNTTSGLNPPTAQRG